MAGNGHIEINTEKLRRAADGMDAVGRTVESILRTLQNTLNAKGSPWGDDDYGHKYAKGESGYERSSENLLTGTGNMVKSLQKFGSGMRQAADKMQTMDQRR
ncbi:hypothetical protein NDR87_19695 [Nocardia sp. CDC159]|uniref:WXG100 family type VII secretion target n=1 Tax=Nocardia pulmonis TaxID=2951408 RepID=A0A9X2E857_9NOCA|nr:MULTISPECIES: hypothetical protein [Nocardia]MCM6776082.1 hypothetical protein [Nocardia pulmonis]MCM6788591.1 hypothetical protein [Nocardia sp. CDC159]